MKVLVIEDYAPVRKAVVQGLREAGFAVDSSGDGEEGLWLAKTNEYDVIVLDVLLPRLDGLSILRQMRQAHSSAHVLILTAKDRLAERVEGINAGADDYLVKPFAFEELLARVRALVRRRYDSKSPVIRIGDLEIDTTARRARRGSRTLDLTAREYSLLEFLALRTGQVVTRLEVWEHVYDSASEASSNVVDVYVGYLRRKLEEDGEPRMIQTRRGQGYSLEAAT
jgi:DNA-binding response OmpR family regulator